MKDITHYFADSFKTSETPPAESKEVSVNSEDVSEINTMSTKNNQVPKKRGRKKGKKSSPDSKNPKKSKSELIIDKSKPLANGIMIDHSDNDVLNEVSKKINNTEIVFEENLNENSTVNSDLMKNDVIELENNKLELCHLENKDKNVCIMREDVKEENVQNGTSHEENSDNASGNTSEKMESEETLTIDDDNRKRRKEKVKILADKKGYSKRKLKEDEEVEEMEKKLQERKNVFTNVPKRDENQSEIVYKPPPYSLLNYFSKATPEQRQKEEAAKCKLSVKAEIHTPKEADTPNSTPNSTPKSHCLKNLLSKKKKAEIKQTLSEIDEIHFVRSESLSPPPILDDKKKPNKPKWRIQFQSDNLANCVSNDEALSPKNSSTIQNENRESEEVIIDEAILNGKKKLSKSENSDTETHQVLRKTRSSNYKKRKDTSEVSKESSYRNKEVRKISQINGINSEVNDQIETMSDEIIIIDEIPSKRSAAEKIAPLFIKKRKLDPTVLEARRLFLQSDMSESETRPVKRKPSPDRNPLLPFPQISHVTQLDSDINSEKCEIKLGLKSPCKYVPSLDISKFNNITSVNDSIIKRWITSLDPSKFNVDIEEVLSDIESRCNDARIMWKSISQTAKAESPKPSPKGRTSKRKSAAKNITKNEVEKIDIQDDVWICKYKPKSTQEIVGNEQAASSLKAWLDKWKTPLNMNEVNSDDDFYSSDCSSSCSRTEYNQVAVLLGPHGCGKTASVYAVAEELGYSVLEINASSRRTGKRILKELEEATKSHRIKKSDMKQTFLKTKTEERKLPQNSLILIEDVDIIFEEDEGFISAAFQLASNTKRPIVMICNETCSHLSKLAPQQLHIKFEASTGSRTSALLELISLAETGRKLSTPCVENLLENGDLRKALLQLQYLLVTGHTYNLPPIVDAQHRFGMPLWQKMYGSLYKPAAKKSTKRKQKTSALQDAENKEVDVLGQLADDLESVSLISKLIGIEDLSWNFRKTKSVINLSLSEDTRPYSYSDTISSDIANWLTFEVIQKREQSEKSVDPNAVKFVNVRTTRTKVNKFLSQVASLTTDQRIIAEDYLPSIRTICRAEEIRNSSNNKRGNRFFHYLHGTRIPMNTANILSAACNFLQEKTKKV